MKKGGVSKENYFTFIFIFVFVLVLITIGLFTGLFGKITGYTNKVVSMNITVGVPAIYAVYNYSSPGLTLSGGPSSTAVYLNFSVYDAAGIAFINDSSAKINVSLSGEVTRNNSVNCTRSQTASTNYVNYTCNLTMFWYDGSGNWAITASILDNSSNFISNSTSTLYVASNTGFDLSPTNLTWSSMSAGSTNQTASNNPLLINNTGNQPIGTGAVATSGNISINATNLKGETTPSYALYANNFSVATVTGGTSCTGSACTECGGGINGNLSVGMYTNVTGAFLPDGNYTINNGTAGQEQLYFCLRIAGSELTSQAYSTLNQGAWTVKLP